MPMIATRRSKGIRTKKRKSGQGEDYYDSYRRTDIDMVKIKGKEYHWDIKIQIEDNSNKNNKKRVTTSIRTVILKIQSN